MKKFFLFLVMVFLFMGPSPVTAASEPVPHEVVPGDTVWSISLKYDVPMWAIVLENGLEDSNHIFVGQRLKVEDPTQFKFKTKDNDGIFVIISCQVVVLIRDGKFEEVVPFDSSKLEITGFDSVLTPPSSTPSKFEIIKLGSNGKALSIIPSEEGRVKIYKYKGDVVQVIP